MKLPSIVHFLASARHGVWIAQGIEIGIVVQSDSAENIVGAMLEALNSYTEAMQALEAAGELLDPIPPLRWAGFWLVRWRMGFWIGRLLHHTEPSGYKKFPTRPLAHA